MGFEIKFEVNNEKDLENLKELINLIQNKNEKHKEMVLKIESDEGTNDEIRTSRNIKVKKVFDFEKNRLTW